MGTLGCSSEAMESGLVAIKALFFHIGWVNGSPKTSMINADKSKIALRSCREKVNQSRHMVFLFFKERCAVSCCQDASLCLFIRQI